VNERRVLLLGATGLVGARALDHLLASAHVASVTVLARRATGRTHARLRELVVDLEGDLGDLRSPTDVLCALGTTMKKAGSKEAFRRVDHDIPLRVARLALDAGARSYALVSSVGADARSGSFYLRTKGELEEELRGLGYRALHLLRPSVLAGDRAEERLGERVGIAVAKAAAGLMVGGLRRYRAIDADDVARALVATTAQPEPAEPTARVLEHDEILALARTLV
jgi:uncharacterized protein YbjT (DUF2867 family)